MKLSRYCAALALALTLVVSIGPASAEGGSIDVPNTGGLEAECDGVYIDDPVGETCYHPEGGDRTYCQWGNPYCQVTVGRGRVGVNVEGLLARPPVGGSTMAPPDTPPSGSLSSPSSGTIAPTNCQLDPNCG